MVIRIAMSMMQAKKAIEEETRREAVRKEDISFTPLAMPSLSGPGAIAVTIGLSAGTQHWIEYTAIVAGIFVVALVAYLTLRASDQIIRFLGVAGINALSKIMGFLLLCVGIQFLINATLKIISDEAFLEQLMNSYQAVVGSA